MGAMASQITSLTIFTQFIQAQIKQIKENIKALRHRPLCGEFTGDRQVTRKIFPSCVHYYEFISIKK